MKYALKRLTASDLTIFEWQFRNINAGNQKAINLNADAFVEQLFPVLRNSAPRSGKLAVDLFVYGPGTHGELNLQRKIVKGAAYKNWRLNGEFIHNPEGEPTRFNTLAPGDLAVFGFDGAPHPDTVYLVLIAQADDARIHRYLDGVLGADKMIALDEARFLSVLERGGIGEKNQLWSLGVEADLEDIASGSTEPIRRVARRRGGRRIDRDQLAKARAAADLVGRIGEAIVAAYLADQLEQGTISKYVWISSENAIAPYDFEVVAQAVNRQFEVKATSGAHARMFPISMAELEAAAASANYDIIRVSEVDVTASKGTLQIAENVGPYAKKVIAACAQLPAGTRVDVVSIDPAALKFQAIGPVTVPTDEDQ